MPKYILVKWPEYQFYMKEVGVFYSEEEDAYFVPEDIYNNKNKELLEKSF